VSGKRAKSERRERKRVDRVAWLEGRLRAARSAAVAKQEYAERLRGERNELVLRVNGLVMCLQRALVLAVAVALLAWAVCVVRLLEVL